MQDTWERRCSPLWVALFCWLFAAAWIWLGVVVIPDFLIRSAFIVLGGLVAIRACFLKRARACIGADRKVLLRTSGLWLSFRSKTNEIPLDRICSVIDRNYIMVWGGRRLFSLEKAGRWLLLQNAEGDEFWIFPPDVLPMRPRNCGRSLAEFLGVKFRAETVEARPFEVFKSTRRIA